MSTLPSLRQAALIVNGCVELKCQTSNCDNLVLVSVWRKPGKYHCDTCRAVNIDDLKSLDNERDVEEEEGERARKRYDGAGNPINAGPESDC